MLPNLSLSSRSPANRTHGSLSPSTVEKMKWFELRRLARVRRKVYRPKAPPHRGTDKEKEKMNFG